MKKLIIAVSVFQMMYGGFIKNIEAKEKLNNINIQSMNPKSLFANKRVPANIRDWWATDYFFGGNMDITGVPFVDILLGIILIPTILTTFGVIFGFMSVGMMLYRGRTNNPPFLFV